MSPGLLIIGLSTSRQEIVQAEMPPYMTATNPFLLSCDNMYKYWCCVSDYQLRSASAYCQRHSYSVNVDITLGYPAANTSSTKGTLTHYLRRPEVHSTHNYHNCSFFVWLHFCWSGWAGWDRV